MEARDPTRSALVNETCLRFLLQTQNADGGWGYWARAQSGTEPTAWALAAMAPGEARPLQAANQLAIDRATRWQQQLENGSWRPEKLPCFQANPRGDRTSK